jgi:hypothetical protein
VGGVSGAVLSRPEASIGGHHHVHLGARASRLGASGVAQRGSSALFQRPRHLTCEAVVATQRHPASHGQASPKIDTAACILSSGGGVGPDVLVRWCGDGEPACKPDCGTARRRSRCERSFPPLTRDRRLGDARRFALLRRLVCHTRVTTGAPARPGGGAPEVPRRPASAGSSGALTEYRNFSPHSGRVPDSG